MAGVKDGSKSDTGLQWPNHDSVHLVVCDVSNLPEVDGIDNFIVAVFFVTI